MLNGGGNAGSLISAGELCVFEANSLALELHHRGSWFPYTYSGRTN
jgi:hypothetical protein